MSKLITNPFECGYSNIEENYREGVCKHPKNLCANCPGPEFPANCPLQDGVIDQQSDKKVGELITSLLKTKRRSKKDCINYSIKAKCCSKPGVPYTCKGINCGHFEPKNKENE
ncbi:MAG: hypothetical protein IMZ64_06580 [Bacteroidetes bacterium]|nr:hypothetical protein [Bacteroidota bacterium]